MAATTEQIAAIHQLTGAASLLPEQREMFSGVWPLVSSLAVCLAAFAGTIWSAFVLWFIGPVFLKARFSFFYTFDCLGAGFVLYCSVTEHRPAKLNL